MGDCNTPSTFQWLMTTIFRDCISWFIHVYLNDIFIYSRSIEEHKKHLGIVFQWLRDHYLFLSKSKVDLYSKRLECLSHIIDDQGIHTDADKMQCIREWRRPRTFNDIQCFLGLVQYLAHYVPDIATWNYMQQWQGGRKHLPEPQEFHHIKAEILNAGDKQSPPSEDTSLTNVVTAIAASNDSKSLQTHVEEMMDLQAIVKNTYHKDMKCAKIITQPDAHPRFSIREGLIWTKNQLKHDVICILWDTFQRGRRLIEIIIDHAHQTIGHYGQWKTSNYIWHSYWWPQMATNIEAFCRSCGKCQTNKTNTQKPQGFLHSLPIPDKPWQLVGMDFMGPLPQSQGKFVSQLTVDMPLKDLAIWLGKYAGLTLTHAAKVEEYTACASIAKIKTHFNGS